MDASVASPRINQYERGKHAPNAAVLAQLGKQLNVPLAYFYAVENDLADLIVGYHRSTTARRACLLSALRQPEDGRGQPTR